MIVITNNYLAKGDKLVTKLMFYFLKLSSTNDILLVSNQVKHSDLSNTYVLLLLSRSYSVLICTLYLLYLYTVSCFFKVSTLLAFKSLAKIFYFLALYKHVLTYISKEVIFFSITHSMDDLSSSSIVKWP